MTWLVFGVSCLLVLAGAVSIISGAPIIQLERGWAEVISGTVALSSGGVVFALAGILMRLETIRDTLAARALPIPAESVALSPPVSSLDKVEALPPVDAPAPPPPLARAESAPVADIVAPEPAPEDETATQGLWKRVKRPGSERPDADEAGQFGFPDRVVPAEPAVAAREGEAGRLDLPVVVPAHDVPAASSGDAAPEIEATPREPAPADRDVGQIGWLERSLFKGRPVAAGGESAAARTERPVEARSFARPAARVEPSMTPAQPSAPAFQVAEPSAAAEPQPTPDLLSDQHQAVTVVGRYQAGSASYVMYSDGTIEVETESGEMHRFDSMDELKAFIAQQDTTVS